MKTTKQINRRQCRFKSIDPLAENPPCGKDEITGKGNTMNYEYRNYDAQTGLFFFGIV